MAVATQKQSMWYRMTPMQVARELNVNPAQGLSTDEAVARLKQYGPNVLSTEKKGSSAEGWARLYRYFIPLTLFVAALLILLYALDLYILLLLASLTIFSILWAVDEDAKAEMNTHIASLAKRVVVRRDGRIIEIDGAALVPGDIVMMTTGKRVPADGRLYIAARLNIDETALTGGSSPTRKETAWIETAQARLGDHTNMAFMNTTVTHGYGVMIVTSTGMNTEIGHIIGLRNRQEMGKKLLQKQHHPMAMDIANLRSLLS
jgi:Ca2+-transporting ATPase